jgi:hypothetical protein
LQAAYLIQREQENERIARSIQQQEQDIIIAQQLEEKERMEAKQKDLEILERVRAHKPLAQPSQAFSFLNTCGQYLERFLSPFWTLLCDFSR